MNVAVIGPTYPESFAENIGNVLVRAGASVTLVDSRSSLTTVLARNGSVPRGVRALERVAIQEPRLRHMMLGRPLASRVREAAPDLVISTDGSLRRDDLLAARRASPGAPPWALWFPDALSNLGAQDALAAGYDRLYFKDALLVKRLRAMTRLPVAFLPEACDPFRHRPVVPTHAERDRFGCDMALAGNMYAYRVEILKRLPQTLDIRLYGNPARNASVPHDWFTRQYVVDRDKSLAFGCATAVLNTMHFAEIESVNARLFEATGCGALVLTEWRPGLEELFEDGTEVLTFRSVDELMSVWGSVASMTDIERDDLRRGAVRRAHRSHAYVDRLATMFEDLGFPQLAWVRHPQEAGCC